MTFEDIQNRIAMKLRKVTAEIAQLESINSDYNTAEGARIDMRLRMLIENSEFLRMLAFFIISQDEMIETLKMQNEAANIRVSALLNISERSLLRSNVALSIASLLQANTDYMKRETNNWLKEELGEEDYQLLSKAA